MTVFVTGGAGYIGSTVTSQLVAAGETVVVFDNLSQGHIQAVHPKAIFIEGDLASRALLDKVMGEYKPDAVMHFASHTLVGESMKLPLRYLGDNVRCGLNLIEVAAKHGVGRFILSSTANLFGMPKELPIEEDAHIAPGSPYGESKYILERILAWMDTCTGMRYAALRYFNACGALSPYIGEDHHPETHLIPLILQVALDQREKIFIFGNDYDTPDGTCVRDYVHVLDLAQAHILALHAIERKSATYNLGNGTGFSVQEVIETARKVTGHPIPAEVAERRPGDPAILIAGSKKIKSELGWQPGYPDLEAIIESAWRWHQAHPNGFGNEQ